MRLVAGRTGQEYNRCKRRKAESSLGYLWLGEVYAEAGRKEEAVTNLKKAEALFQELGMDYWLVKARKVLKTVEEEGENA